jgi:hypothetical protein
MNRNLIVKFCWKLFPNAAFRTWILKFPAFPIFEKSKDLHSVLLSVAVPARSPANVAQNALLSR